MTHASEEVPWRAPSPRPRAATTLTYRHLSVLNDAPADAAVAITLAELYRRIIDTAQPTIAAVLVALAEPGALPAVVHCTAAKDRTGLIIALLLGLAGVPDATIAADYALTARYLEGDYWHGARQRARVREQGWTR